MNIDITYLHPESERSVMRLLKILYGVWKLLLDIIFPMRCPVCDEVVPFGRLICQECRTEFELVKPPRCLRCGRHLESMEAEYCTDCRSRKHLYTQGRALYDYRSVATSLYRFKYAGRQEYGTYYAREMADFLGDAIKCWNAEVLVPVPIHYKRKHTRGYNQAEVLAKELGKLLEMPVDAGLIKRVKKTVPQKLLDDKQRQNNLKKAFKIGRNDVKWKSVIIVDDIYTTGSTIDACASVLLGIGIQKIYFVALAIGRELQ